MILQERLKELDAMELLKGFHADNNGKCALEAVAWLAGEKHSDHPVCVSAVLGDFCRSCNDSLDDIKRQQLKPYLPRLIGTAGDEAKDLRRSWMAFDWVAREFCPAFMDLTKTRQPHATALRALPEIKDMACLQAVLKSLRAARDADWDTGWDAGWAAGAGGAAVRAAGWAAIGAAARAAVGDAGWDAGWDALAPVVARLQTSAFELLERMIAA